MPDDDVVGRRALARSRRAAIRFYLGYAAFQLVINALVLLAVGVPFATASLRPSLVWPAMTVALLAPVGFLVARNRRDSPTAVTDVAGR